MRIYATGARLALCRVPNAYSSQPLARPANTLARRMVRLLAGLAKPKAARRTELIRTHELFVVAVFSPLYVPVPICIRLEVRKMEPNWAQIEPLPTRHPLNGCTGSGSKMRPNLETSRHFCLFLLLSLLYLSSHLVCLTCKPPNFDISCSDSFSLSRSLIHFGCN